METRQSGGQCKSFMSVMRNFALKTCVVFAFISLLAGCSRDYTSSNNQRSQTFSSVPYAAPMPVRQPRTFQQPYQPYYYGVPNSRSYYNPYDFQQPYGRNPYSDYDQYYVPPTQYYNNEYDNGDASAFSSRQ